MATKRLGALGAEIIKVESTTRPEFAFRQGWFAVVNNKRSCTLNIASVKGQALLRPIVPKSDVIVENFSSRVFSKNNLAYEDLRGINPNLIYVSASGLDRTGPERDMVAYGTLLQASSGRVSLIGAVNVDLEAMGVMPAWTDPVTSLWESYAIMAALRHRMVTGEGAYIDLSMLEATVALLPDALFHTAASGATTERGSRTEIGPAPSGCFKCRDGDSWVAVSVRDDGEWERLVRAMASANLAGGDPAFQDRAGRLERKVSSIVSSPTSAQRSTRATWRRRCSANGCPRRDRAALAIFPPTNICGSAASSARSMTARGASPCHGWMTKGWRGALSPMPRLGGDNDYVFGEILGLSVEDQRKLNTIGAIA